MIRTILNLDVFEQRFKSMFKEAPFSAALLSGDDFLIEMANDATLMLWGKDESIVGKPLLEAMPEMAGQAVFEDLRRVYSTGETFEGQERTAYLNLGGTLKKVYVNFIFKAIRDDNGQIAGVLAVGYNVTDQVVAKQRLEQAEARARIAIESVGLGTFEKDLERGEFYASKRLDQIFGFERPGRHEDYVSRLHPNDQGIREAAHGAGLESGLLSYEARIFKHNGDERWVKVHGTYLFDENHRAVRLIGTVHDITEEKLSLENLKESEARFRTLITETPEVGMALYSGPEIRIKYVNNVMLGFWDKDESVIGKTIREAMPVLEGQPFFDQFDQVYKTGIAYTGTEQKAILERGDKLEARYFNYTYKPLKDSAGKVYGIHHMTVDVTDQVKYKLALIEREESVQRLFEQTPVGIAVFKGPLLVIEMANETMLQFWGRKRNEVIDQPAWKALPEIKDQGIDKIAENVLQTGAPYTSPETQITVMRAGKQETITVNFAFQPLRNTEGGIEGLLAIANDVTEIANARQNAERNEMRLRALANSMPQVVWIANEDGSVAYYNDRVQAFAGARKDDNGVWHWEGMVHPDDLTQTWETWSRAVKTHQVYQIEHRIKMKDGSHRWHLSRAYPYETDEGIKWYGTATDVHDQKTLEMNLESLVRERTLELQRSNDDLQQFAHVASHDLKEPLRKIKTFSFKLQDEFQNTLGDRGNTFIRKIISATDRMYAMINGVLNYASLNAGEHGLQHVDLNRIVKHILIDLEVPIGEKKAIIDFANLPQVYGNADLLYQLFYNLINNALKFSHEGIPSKISISSATEEQDSKEYHEITVADNGIGFDQVYAEKIFSTFFRLNSKDKYEGSGLGLALCKKIVESHRGSISAKGQKNVGAEFKILLPKE
ncbi:PAS domain-containing protein [Fulvivirgaceae bacterium PWU4]|uniref:histidine kinase n=1 Tax=Chryseosolibacter histidini TaxID=2782349 RepID=A0AAP2DFJ8_9BACT|nr:PAS domain-containing protein [Chryseosolibacter histidini]MBT1695420.1 PAS domain-containing protein [Chryseosolibacter histidini]